MTTIDMAYVDLMLDARLTDAQRKNHVVRLRKLANRLCGVSAECPECGAETDETNGCSGASLAYCCGECGTTFDAAVSS